MKAAGLTHGGFYKHFESKDQLVSEACAEAVEALIERVSAAGSGAAATYLSTRHRDNPADGCPLSTIGSELGRSDEKTRAVATDGFLKLVEIMAGQFGKIPPGAARRRALVAVSTMIGGADDVAYRDRPRPVGRDSSVGREEHDRQMSGRSARMFRRRFRLSACGRQRRRRRGAVAIHHGGRPEQAPPTLPDNSIVADYYPGKKVSHPCTY